MARKSTERMVSRLRPPLLPSSRTSRRSTRWPRPRVRPPSSAVTAFPSPAPTGPTSRRPTRTCSRRRSTGSPPASGSAARRVGQVVAGAVLKHSRDFNLTRECRAGHRALDSATPAVDIQQACDTGIQAALIVAAQHRARPDRVGHRRRRRHHERRAGRHQRGPARSADGGQPDEDARPAASSCSAGCARARSSRRSRATRSRARACRWASTPPSPPSSGASAARSRTSWPRRRTSAWPRRGRTASSTTWSPRTWALEARQQPAARLDGREAREAEARLRRRARPAR